MAYLADDAQYLFEPVATADHVDFGSHGVYGAAVYKNHLVLVQVQIYLHQESLMSHKHSDGD